MPENLPILYSFRRCPYAMRARLALRSAGIKLWLREVLRNKPVASNGHFPKATVPVLQLADGGVVEQSLDIMHWAFDHADPEGCAPKPNNFTISWSLTVKSIEPHLIALNIIVAMQMTINKNDPLKHYRSRPRLSRRG